MNNYKEIQERYPFLTLLKIQGKEVVGIVQNTNDKFLTYYDYGAIKSDIEKKLFLELGELWYWESNRSLPINIFLFEQMRIFSKYIKSSLLKEITVVFGPTTSLDSILKKRVKKKTIQLVRKT